MKTIHRRSTHTYAVHILSLRCINILQKMLHLHWFLQRVSHYMPDLFSFPLMHSLTDSIHLFKQNKYPVCKNSKNPRHKIYLTFAIMIATFIKTTEYCSH